MDLTRNVFNDCHEKDQVNSAVVQRMELELMTRNYRKANFTAIQRDA